MRKTKRFYLLLSFLAIYTTGCGTNNSATPHQLADSSKLIRDTIPDEEVFYKTFNQKIDDKVVLDKKEIENGKRWELNDSNKIVYEVFCSTSGKLSKNPYQLSLKADSSFCIETSVYINSNDFQFSINQASYRLSLRFHDSNLEIINHGDFVKNWYEIPKDKKLKIKVVKLENKIMLFINDTQFYTHSIVH